MRKSIKIWTAIVYAGLPPIYFLWFKFLGYRGLSGAFTIQIIFLASLLFITYKHMTKRGADNAPKRMINVKMGKLSIIVGGLIGATVWVDLHGFSNLGACFVATAFAGLLAIILFANKVTEGRVDQKNPKTVPHRTASPIREKLMRIAGFLTGWLLFLVPLYLLRNHITWPVRH
jgi:hypothetical protein